jgi:hypothetical protein
LDHRRPHTRLGFAYQLAFLRLTGRLPRQKPLEIAPDLLHVVALQLGDSVGGDPERASEELGRYAQRQPTISAHAEEIKAYLGYRAYEGADEQVALRCQCYSLQRGDRPRKTRRYPRPRIARPCRVRVPRLECVDSGE